MQNEYVYLCKYTWETNQSIVEYIRVDWVVETRMERENKSLTRWEVMGIRRDNQEQDDDNNNNKKQSH
jgi:hypothetical protein